MSQLVVKVKLRGTKADWIANDLAVKYQAPVEVLPCKWWQRTPARQVTIPYPGDDAYRLLQSWVVVQVGVSNTAVRVWAERTEL